MNRSRQSTLRLAGLLAAFVVCALCAFAQAPSKTPVMDASHFGDKVDLTGDWLVRAGDDLAWASPTLDESGWTLVSQKKALNQQGLDHPVRAWYRKRVHLRPDAKNVSLLVGENTASYAVYVNGRLLRTRGSLEDGASPVEGNAEPIVIPDELVAASGGDLNIAFRFYNGLHHLDADALPPSTTVELITPHYASLIQSAEQAHTHGLTLGIGEFYLIIGFCGLVLWLALRRQTEYLALAVWMVTSALNIAFTIQQQNSVHSVASLWVVLTCIVGPLSIIGQIEFVRISTGTRRWRWLLAIEIAALCVSPCMLLIVTGKLSAGIGVLILFAPYLISSVLLPFLLIRASLRGDADARLLLVPFLLWGFRTYYGGASVFSSFVLRRELPWPSSLHVGGYAISPDHILDAVGLFALLLIILFRTIRLTRDRAALTAEFAAAEQMQTLLLERSSRPTPGYRIETEYLPAGEVGGDFFLISPAEDGSLLAIVGDVSGKGLQAAMRVALILGALNRETSRDPAAVMTNLNHTLLAQGDVGFTTACCLHLQPTGLFTFTNAGHLNPYLSGTEHPSPGQLPLGLTATPDFTVETGTLVLGQRLVLVSDGVAEARNAKGELFGFERTAAVSTESAKYIAQTAKTFGQDDDITVVTIELQPTL